MDWIQTIPTAIVLSIIPIITNMAWKIYQWVSSEERVKRSLALREALGKSGFKSEKPSNPSTEKSNEIWSDTVISTSISK